jgi:hypothetical protein
MRYTALFAAAALALAVNPLGGQPAKEPARVSVSGKEEGILTIDDGKTKERFVVLEVAPKLIVMVQTEQDVEQLNEQILAQHRKLFAEFSARAKELAAKNDIEGIKKAEKEFQEASKELQGYFSYYVAEGKLTVVNGELRLAGKLRPYAFKGADKALGKGKAVVEGEAVRVKFDDGSGEKMVLAIANDPQPIALVGKAAQDKAEAKGILRAHGTLRVTKGGPVLEVESVEAVKK